MNILEQLKRIGDFFTSRGITDIEQLDQALSIGSVWDKAYKALYQIEGTDYPYIMDIFEDANERYIVYTDNGNLYKTVYTVTSNDEVELGEPVQVKMEFIEVPEQTQAMQIFQSATGDYKFVSISACSVINRVGEIDSNELFDKFVERFDKDNPPYITFYHLGEAFKFGHVEQIFHYENFLISMGVLYQDHILTQAAIEKFPSGEWGVSPAFWVYESKIEQIGDVKVPVYTDGELFEISVLQEVHAANYFTKIQGYKNREMQMSANERKRYEDLLTDFVGEDNADEVIKVLDDVEERQRKIEEKQMIYRENKEEGDELEEELEVIEEEETEIEIDDEVIAQIAERVNQSIEEKFQTISEHIQKLFDGLQEFKKEQDALKLLVTEEVEQVKREDDKKIEEKVQDLPKAKLKVGYRSRTQENEKDNLGVEVTNDGILINDPKAIRERAKKIVGDRK